MNLELVTPVILTSNEEVNIQRTLNALPWAETVVVLDSFSSDHTEAICRKFKNVRFQQRQFTTHSEQWNAAVQLASTPWILSLDADYQVSSNLLNKIKELEPSLSVKGYAIPFLFAVNGISLRAHLLPPRIAQVHPGWTHARSTSQWRGRKAFLSIYSRRPQTFRTLVCSTNQIRRTGGK